MAIRLLGIDYAGTLTQTAPDGTHLRRRPYGADATRLLGQRGITTPPGFVSRFDRLFRTYWGEKGAALERLLAHTLPASAITGVDMAELADALISQVGDHPVDTGAAKAVRTLHSWGLTCVLTSNTSRTTTQRRAALEAADLGFMQLWLSSEVGYAKPDWQYYQQLFDRFDITPQEFAGVGDFPRTDVAGAAMMGSPTVLVDTWPVTDRRAEQARNLGAVVIPTLTDLPCHLWPQGPSENGWELRTGPVNANALAETGP